VSHESNAEDGGTSRTNFIREIVEDDLESGKHDEIVTRFPPEPNGYLHIGHAKSIVLNHEIALDYDGRFHLRFDDTNPLTEEQEYIDSIKRDVAWLGADWGEHLYYASDYFERMYELAERLIKKGKAYVDSLSSEEIKEMRGSWDEPGEESPYRDRSVEENLDLFRRMRDGEFEEGEHVLRAKIDMQADNTLMRDPVLYRILHAEHPRTEGDWCIYPMYDYAHCLEDAFEGITHSLCTLEFENNRDIYNWVIEETEVDGQPRQIEFAAGNISYTIMSKSRLRELVEEGYVDGWDDPRLPTLSAVRRRGIPPEAIRNFWNGIGVARNENVVEIAQFEHAIRDTLNPKAPRVMAIEDPVRLVIENYPDDEEEWLEMPHFPDDLPGDESRMVPFSRELFVERDDVEEDPPEGFYRLHPGNEVRLRYGYFVTCEEIVRDDTGEIQEVRCSYDPETRGGSAPDGRNPEGTIQWVSAEHALPCELRLYDRLFEVEDPRGREQDFKEFLNDASLVVEEGWVEPSVRHDPPGTRYQFERNGYFVLEPHDSSPDDLVFNRIVTLRDRWASEETERRKEKARRRAEEKRRKKERKRKEAERARERRIQALVDVAHGREVDDYDPSLRDETRFDSPELRERLETYLDDLELDPDEADVLSGDLALANFYDEARRHYDAPDTVGAWIVNELLPEIDAEVGTPAFTDALESLPFGSDEVAELIEMFEDDRITNRVMRDVLEAMFETGGSPEAIVEREGWESISDTDALESTIDDVLAEHPDNVEAYAEGETQLLNFFMGQVMQATGGQADPQLVRELLADALPEPEE
jgi:glutaminyl-tRNA synthetase